MNNKITFFALSLIIALPLCATKNSHKGGHPDGRGGRGKRTIYTPAKGQPHKAAGPKRTQSPIDPATLREEPIAVASDEVMLAAVFATAAARDGNPQARATTGPDIV